MSKVYVISDLHFSHHNMAIKRGFKDAVSHDNHIIDTWNSIVTKRDVVWILGDITMEKSQGYELLDKLNGVKKVVLGNHDKPQHSPKLLEYVNHICGCVKLKGCILTHIPIHESEVDRFLLNIHGHIHDEVIPDLRYVNVCAENVDYKPVLLDKLVESKRKSDFMSARKNELVMNFKSYTQEQLENEWKNR